MHFINTAVRKVIIFVCMHVDIWRGVDETVWKRKIGAVDHQGMPSDYGLWYVRHKSIVSMFHSKFCSAALCCLAENCLKLKELDISGCLSVTNKTLYALQESLLHMRDPAGEGGVKPSQFSIIVGGKSWATTCWLVSFPDPTTYARKGSEDVGADSWFRKLSDYASMLQCPEILSSHAWWGLGTRLPADYLALPPRIHVFPAFQFKLHAVEKIGEPGDKADSWALPTSLAS